MAARPEAPRVELVLDRLRDLLGRQPDAALERQVDDHEPTAGRPDDRAAIRQPDAAGGERGGRQPLAQAADAHPHAVRPGRHAARLRADAHRCEHATRARVDASDDAAQRVRRHHVPARDRHVGHAGADVVGTHGEPSLPGDLPHRPVLPAR